MKLGNIANLLKNAKNMQAMVETAQEELDKIEITGEAGAGMVKVTMTARHNVQSVELDDELMKEDKSVIQDLLVAAINDANLKVEVIAKDKMMSASSMFGGEE